MMKDWTGKLLRTAPLLLGAALFASGCDNGADDVGTAPPVTTNPAIDADIDTPAEGTAEQAGEAIDRGAAEVGENLRQGANEAGAAIDRGLDRAGEAVREGAAKTREGVNEAADAVQEAVDPDEATGEKPADDLPNH